MRDPQPTPLENLLVGRIEDDLQLERESLKNSQVVLRALREVLESTKLSKEELAAIEAGGRPSVGSPAYLRTLIEIRIERALKAGFRAATGKERATRSNFSIPRVVVVDDLEPEESPQECINRTIRSVQAPPEPVASSGRNETSPSLILADTMIYREMQDRSSENNDELADSVVEADLGQLRAQLSGLLSGLASDPEGGGESVALWDKQKLGELRPGEVISGKYRVVRKIGTGGFGSVYEAEDESLGTRVAIKYLHPRSSNQLSDHEMLKAEARRVTRLNHPNIVDWKVFDTTEDGSYYFVMELLQGVSLEKTLEDGTPLEPQRVGLILLAVLDALRTAHHLSKNESILHLDLKPQHVFIEPKSGAGQERIKVIDFGIGQYIGAAEDAETVSGLSAASPSMTRMSSTLFSAEKDPANDHEEGMGRLAEALQAHIERKEDEPESQFLEHYDHLRDILDPQDSMEQEIEAEDQPEEVRSVEEVTRCHACTPEYASPEQCAHMLPFSDIVALDGRSDLYSLGVMGFQMLTGRLPFDPPENRGEWLRIHMEDAPRKAASAHVRVSRPLAHFLDRCLEKDRDKRFKDTNEAFDVLEKAMQPSVAKQVVKVTIPAVLLTAIVLGVLFRMIGSTEIPGAFDLRIDGTNQNLLDYSSLWFDDDHQECRLQVRGLEKLTDTPGIRIVTEKTDEASKVVDSWDVSWEGAGSVSLRALGLAQRLPSAYLEISTDGKRFYSKAFRLIYLHPSSWGFTTVKVEGLGTRDLDPTGKKLSIGLQAEDPGDLMEDVMVTANGDWSSPLLCDPTRKRVADGEIEYTLNLDSEELALGEGKQTLSLKATSRAGTSKQYNIVLTVVSSDLVSKVALTSPNGRHVYDWEKTRLTIDLNRIADVKYTVTAKGQDDPLAQKTEVGQRSYSIPLIYLSEQLEPPVTGSFEVSVDDSRYVDHKEKSRGEGSQSIDFVYTQARPEYSARVRWDGGSHPLDRAGEVIGIPSRRAQVTIRLEENSAPTDVGLFCPDKRLKQHDPITLARPKEESDAVFSFSFPKDGRYAVWPIVLPYVFGIETKLDPEGAPSWIFYVDTTHPRLTLNAPDEPPVVTRQSPAPPVFSLVVMDAIPETEQESKIDLIWRLERGDPSHPLEIPKELMVPQTTRGSVATSFEAPLLKSGGEKSTDGTYRLSVFAKDIAGNRSLEESVIWIIAQDGPTMTLSSPTGRDWKKGSKGWEIWVTAEDGNGIESVDCKLVAKNGEENMVELIPDDEEPGSWKGAVPRFLSSWAETDVSFELIGRDLYENETITPILGLRRLPPSVEELPDEIRVVFPGREVDVSNMKLVPRNDQPYVFGGRDNQKEVNLFAEAGLRAYTPNWSWMLPFKVGEIQGYYLDVHEVTRGQFREFVIDPGGYQNRTLWPPGSASTPPRRAELEKELSTDPDSPVTGVDWPEACAYARWAKKRLPSWAEWEYECRGGAEYRPYPCYSSGEPLSPGEINADNAFPSPWPRSRELVKDRSKHGIFNLAGNVREWTSAFNISRAKANRRYLDFLYPNRSNGWDSQRKYRIVGGSFSRSEFDFTCVRGEERSRRQVDVGFRCAIAANVVAESLHKGHGSTVRYEAVP